MGSATPTPDSSSVATARPPARARQASHAPAGSANTTASSGRIVAATPSPSPASRPHQGELDSGDEESRVARASAAVATSNQASVVAWFMCEPNMNTPNGATTNSVSAPRCQRRVAVGSRAPSTTANASTLTAPASGPTSHSAPTSEPNISIAGPPTGNCANVRSPRSTRLSTEKNSRSGGVATLRCPSANQRA